MNKEVRNEIKKLEFALPFLKGAIIGVAIASAVCLFLMETYAGVTFQNLPLFYYMTGFNILVTPFILWRVIISPLEKDLQYMEETQLIP